MTKKQQDLAWACLPKEARNQIVSTYFCKRDSDSEYNKGYVDAILHIYGTHNLTSDTEPKEMLMVERKKVQKIYSFNDAIIKNDPTHSGAWLLKKKLDYLFGDKCLPDKLIEEKAKEIVDTIKDSIDNPILMPQTMLYPQPPKLFFESDYSIGDKMIVCISSIGEPRKEVVSLIHQYQPQCEYNDYAKTWVIQTQDGQTFQSNEELFEPYTEPETKDDTKNETKDPVSQNPDKNCNNKNNNSISDNMETKELNLCELLKGCVGEWFYVTPCGEMELKEINKLELKPLHFSRDTINCLTKTDGRAYENGSCIIYPSRALYEKYPLDPVKAWEVWASERKPKYRLQIKIIRYKDGEWLLNEFEEVEFPTNTLEEAQQATEAVRETLQKFLDKNTEK